MSLNSTYHNTSNKKNINKERNSSTGKESQKNLKILFKNK